MTYEGARSILGPFLKGLGASAAQVGLIAGLGEMFAASLRLFSGRFADRTRAYWTITIFGYAVNLIAVPALAFVGNWQLAALLVILERTGKSLRGPARDVLLSEATGVVGHGWGFGLHAAFDQAGAVLGPLFVAAAVARTNSFGPAFLWLSVPALAALATLLVARAMHPTQGAAVPVQIRQPLPRVFWTYVAAAGLLACGFVDFPLLYAGAMAMNGITAPVFGRLFDRYGLLVLVFGILVSLLALPLGFLGGRSAVIASIACWGAGMGAQDACLRSGISQVVSMDKRGGAFGAFNAVYGVMWFLGSAAMGLLYDRSLTALVAFGIAAQLAAAAMFLRLRGKLVQAAHG